jgi:outer membrane protein assembly factor BamB
MLVLLSALAVLAGGCDWPMFRQGPEHSGSSADTSISTATVSSSMVLAWTATTGGVVESSPAVANGVVYVGSNDRKLYAFDATGSAGCAGTPKKCAPLWTSVGTGASIFSSPVVVNGVVYVGSEDGTLYAFDAKGTTNCAGVPRTCIPLWTAATKGLIESSPTVVDGVVYVGSGHSDKRLYAFDAAGTKNCSGNPVTCTPLWTAAASQSISSSPAVAGGVVYVGSQDGALYAFDAAGVNGCSGTPVVCSPMWTSTVTGGSIFSSPSVVGGVVYVGSNDGNLYAFDANGNTGCSGAPVTCAPLWSATTGGSVGSSPAVTNGVVYVGSNDGKLYAFDANGNTGCSGNPKTCAALWTSQATGAPVFSSPGIANGVVYVGSNNNHIYAFDASSKMKCSGTPKVCSPLWGAKTGGSVASSPAVANGMVYVGSDDHKLYAFGLETTPPVTSVAQPSDGSTVSGTTTLSASASDDVAVSKVEFRLTGGTYNDAVIGVATGTRFGWIFNWNTTSVPNGAYTLTSVATDPAGNVGRSAGVAITVAN